MDAEVTAAVGARIERFDADWSRFRPDARIAALRDGPASINLPDDAGPMLALYDTLHDLTDGAMSPCVGAGLEHLGYDASYSLRPGAGWVPAPAWRDVRRDDRTLSTPGPVVLDVGAAGKGRLVDLVDAVLDAHGVGERTVDASGDLLHRGAPIRVALEHPADPRRAVGVVEVGDAALCASATNRRSWADGVHHVLDARTGRPVTDVLATWVLAADAMVADALATALFFVPADRLTPVGDFDYLRISRSRGLEHSPDLPGEVFR